MTKQDYGVKPFIDGVQIKDLKVHYMEDGSFMELFRFGEHANTPEFLQINLSVIVPGAIKGFHKHDFQNDRWATWEPLLVRLYDGRLDSPTFNMSMRFMLCNQALFIPKGVSHGASAIQGRPVHLLYAVDQLFNPSDPDEIREPWDMLDSALWEMQKG